jgi:HEAT repeat protein
MNFETIDQALEALKTYDWGTDRGPLAPLEAAIVTTREDAAARADLIAKLSAALASEISRDAKDVVCRLLMVVGTAEAVPALAALLAKEELSHMARYALERIPDPAAAQALREAIPQLAGKLRAGVIGSLGVRKDADSVAALSPLLGDADAVVARAAAGALGNIGTGEAVTALSAANVPAECQMAVTDALLACAEKLLANNQRTEAMKIYKKFLGDQQPKHVRLAGTRGMLACAGTQE